ncbi:hypothetical protein [Georgenia sp. H159]|uniref:hypothetical protein n=1 Tax=Georgenia sp. H159 TaxID=3076115 RepID=UPI002D79908B|nr:hypothetical protein [Georgenia sp. H159]
MRRAAGAVATAVVLLTACAPAQEVPAEEEVAELLDSAYVARTEPEELCDLASSAESCRASLEDAPPAPEEVPTLHCSDVVEEADVEARAVRVSGVARDGSDYDATLLVIATPEGARFVDPVYWSAADLSSEDVADLSC